MEKILGIDLGTNSLGWAIREINNDLNNQIIDKGVLTFDKGVAEEKGIETPMVQKRTESRSKRRNYQAEKYRKWELLDILIDNKMCPLSKDELNEWKHYKKGIGRKYPQSKRFIEWLRFDFNGDGKPDFNLFGSDKHESYYIFRALAVSDKYEHKSVFSNNPEILGRIFYQLVQRRGFKGRDEDEAQTMLKGSKDGTTKGRNDINTYIEIYKTLGAALYHLQDEQNVRIRKRYNLRSDIDAELKEICKTQNLNSNLYKGLWKAIIWQRPLRSQKGLIGICTFEQKTIYKDGKEITQGKQRCPISHPLYEEFRTWIFINNLKINVPIEIDRSKYIKEKIYPLFYNSSSDFKLSTILKQLKKDGAYIESNFKEDTKAISSRLLNSFEKLFGETWKQDLSWNESLNNENKKCDYSFEDIWHVLFSFDSNDKLNEFAINKLNLDNEKAKKFSEIKLQQGYATLSLSAIKKILPFLYEGFVYSEAIYLANLPKVFGEKGLNNTLIKDFNQIYSSLRNEHEKEKILNACINELIRDELNSDYRYRIENGRELDESENNMIEQKLVSIIGIKSWNNKSEEEKAIYKSYVHYHFRDFLQKPFYGKKDILFMPVPNFHDKIKNYLRDTFNINEKQLGYLWHPSEQESYPDAKEKRLENGVLIKVLGNPLPISNGFKNPMALKTLYKLKNLINYLLENGKIDYNTRVVVEIARELNDANKRKAIEKWQREREKENEDFKKIIDEINTECRTNFNREDKTLIDKVRLWKEQNMRCLYTGKQISLCKLFDGLKYDIEHTIPASMSFDNELKNLTIADSFYNREIKKKNIPFDCPNYSKEATINGETYSSILNNIEYVFGKRSTVIKKIKGVEKEFVRYEKIEHLEDLFYEWKKKTSDKKDIKDAIIQRRHLIKMELDYWRKKLETFTCTEYKASWRNSQLKDTQTITKYALPYLKTVFKKVEVQKGEITNDFRIIYEVQPKKEKKNRTIHAHHAIDAAVLTLVPPSATRDKILKAYNEEKDNNTGKVYHEKPQGWNNFDASHIISIADNILINYQAQHRTLSQSSKLVKKRGKQQYVKYKDENGKWHFKLDNEEKKIPLIAKGDTIRGQLHKESFFGAVKLNDEIFLVERYPISSFTSINDCKHIVDKTIKEIVQTTLEKRIELGQTFDQAKLEPISFPTSNTVIKKVRCKVAAGRGYLTATKAIPVKKHTFLSKKEHKQYIYAQNEENTLCLYYEQIDENVVKRAFRIIGLYELSQLKLNSFEEIKNENYYKNIGFGRGKNAIEIPINTILKVGTKVIFYNKDISELNDLSKTDLLKRTYRVYKFNEMGTPFIYLQNHLEASPNDKLGSGDTIFDSTKYQARLQLVSNNFTCAIEGRDFIVKLDGEIKFLF